MIATTMFYTNAAILVLGALVVVLLLLACVSRLTWFVYQGLVGWPTIVKAMKMYRATNEQEQDGEGWEAELGRTAMQFVDRAGDVHPGIDDAETICAEFYKAMMAVIERMPHVQRMSKPGS